MFRPTARALDSNSTLSQGEASQDKGPNGKGIRAISGQLSRFSLAGLGLQGFGFGPWVLDEGLGFRGLGLCRPLSE